jgi:hypothetical protein
MNAPRPDGEAHGMSEGESNLVATLDAQVSELMDVLHANGEDALGRQCIGRENLGDGTIAAAALHAADSYQRIAQLVQRAATMAAAGTDEHFPQRSHGHDATYTAENVQLDDVIHQVVEGRRRLVAAVAELSDAQLRLVPPAGSARFCDGQRTLEEVVAAALSHQQQHIKAIKESST